MKKTKHGTNRTKGKTKFREYIFAVVFRNDNGHKFLVFQRTKNWRGWELLKGGLKDNESEIQALKREIREETGAKKYKIICKTRHVVKYRWLKQYAKDHHLYHGAKGRLYLVKLFGKKVKIDRKEHGKFKWADRRQALKLLTYINLKNALKYVLRNHNLS